MISDVKLIFLFLYLGLYVYLGLCNSFFNVSLSHSHPSMRPENINAGDEPNAYICVDNTEVSYQTTVFGMC